MLDVWRQVTDIHFSRVFWRKTKRGLENRPLQGGEESI